MGTDIPTEASRVGLSVNTALFALTNVVVLLKAFSAAEVLVCFDCYERCAANLALLINSHFEMTVPSSSFQCYLRVRVRVRKSEPPQLRQRERLL